MWKMKTNLIALLLMSAAQLVFSATDSTGLTPPNTTARKMCYQLTIDGVTLSGTPQYFTQFASGFCVPWFGGGAGFAATFAPVLLTGGGSTGESCPSWAPYLIGNAKIWIGSFVWPLPPIWSVTEQTFPWCCSAPMHVSSMTSSWQTPDASGKCPVTGI